MRNIFFILFFAANLFAQVPGQDVVRDCFYATPYTIQQYRINDPKGMQLSRADYEDSLQSGNPSILQPLVQNTCRRRAKKGVMFTNFIFTTKKNVLT